MARLPIVLLLLLALFGICGAEPSAPNRASQILTAAVAEKVLGASVQAADGNFQADTLRGPIWVSNAYYSLAQAPAPAPFVALLVRHASDATEAKQGFSEGKATFQGQPVAGLGVPAYRTAQPAQLHLLVGRKWLILSCGTFQKPDLNGQILLAKLILASLKE